MHPTIVESRLKLQELEWRKSVVLARGEVLALRENLTAIPIVANRATVITICFNAVGCIASAFDSIRRQTYSEIEYLVIDGNSLDGTVELIKAAGSCVDLAISLTDTGIADAFNRGIALSTGEYIIFLNADDLWPSDHVERSIAALKKNPNSAFVFGDIVRVDVPQERYYIFNGDPEYQASLQGWPPEFNHPSFVTRRTAFETAGLFDPTYRVCMDLDWLIRLTQAGLTGHKISTWVVMRCGGISDQSRRMFGDVREILVASGVSRVKACLLWMRATAKTWVSGALRRATGDQVVDKLRRRINRNFVPTADSRIEEAKQLIFPRAN